MSEDWERIYKETYEKQHLKWQKFMDNVNEFKEKVFAQFQLILDTQTELDERVRTLEDRKMDVSRNVSRFKVSEKWLEEGIKKEQEDVSRINVGICGYCLKNIIIKYSKNRSSIKNAYVLKEGVPFNIPFHNECYEKLKEQEEVKNNGVQ